MTKSKLKKEVCKIIDKWGDFIYDIDIWIKSNEPVGNVGRIYRYNRDGLIPELKNDKGWYY